MHTTTTTGQDLAKQERAQKITRTRANAAVLSEFFGGMDSGRFGNGMSHQLYFCCYSESINWHLEHSDNSWHQRNDGSYVKLKVYSNVYGREKQTEYANYTDFRLDMARLIADTF